MGHPVPLELARLRRSCAECSLQQLCLPAGVDGEDLGKLDALVQRQRPLQPGEALFRAGDPLASIYVASEGAFKTVVVNEAGEEHVLGFHLPGELFGLDAIGSGRHRCDAIALVEARACALPFARLAEVAAQLPSLQKRLLQGMGRSADLDHDHVDMLSRRQAGERIAFFLRGLGERYRRIGRPDDDFRLPMSREDIARYLGLALETVSRSFSRLHDEGVIDVRGRRVRILRPQRLQASTSDCGQEPVARRPKLRNRA
jgi:CRP/FNR family transcriptional regulator